MKKTTWIMLAGILTSIVCCCLAWSSRQPVNTSRDIANVSDTTHIASIIVRRPSIAFILGEDKEADNPYYDEAFRYYSTNPEGKTDFVIRSIRSLVEARAYLQGNKPSNAPAWGTVHLVSHGNQWTGLSVKVAPGSKRANTQRIVEYIQSDSFEALQPSVVDSQTKIFLHGCGVGNDASLVDAVTMFFGGKNNQPMVFAPKLFEYYASTGAGKDLRSQRYMAQNWLISYPMGEKPSAGVLTNALREKFSGARVDWSGALLREQPRWIGDVYHYTFEVPVKWTIQVDSLPDLSHENQRIVWLQTQQHIVNELNRLQIPAEKFKWSFSSGYTKTEAGVKRAAISVKGYCTMLCVLQALTDDHNVTAILRRPIVPDLTDKRFYYSSHQTRLAGI